MPAGETGYDGVPYGDLAFDEIDWSEVGEHDPARRAERKGTHERNVLTEWATEACQTSAAGCGLRAAKAA